MTTIIKAEVLKNIDGWTAPAPFDGKRHADKASDELFRIQDKVTDRGSYFAAVMKIVDDTELLVEYFNGAVQAGLNDITDEYLETFCLTHNLLEQVYEADVDPATVEEFALWDWDDCVSFSARLVTMHDYFHLMLGFIKCLPALNDYWQHLVDAHNFFASSEAPTARKEVFHIFVGGKLKQQRTLQKLGVIAPRCLDLKTGKVYQEAMA